MNKNWRNRPTSINSFSKKIDWIVAIDESGNSDLSFLCKQKLKNRKVNDGDKHFTVSACALRIDDFEATRDKIMNLKNKYWQDALFNYNGVQKRVCFHSKEIRERKNAFSPNVIDYTAFIDDLSDMMCSLPITLFSAHINKWEHIKKYTRPYNPYNLCLDFILERIIHNMRKDETCFIVLESRGKKEDQLLLDTIKKILDNGNEYRPTEFFSQIKGVFFNSKWCKEADCKMSYWELELADLCAFPIHKFLSYGKRDKSFDVLEKKLYGYPNTNGHGIKSFP